MHFQGGGVNEKARANELIVHLMVPQDVADVLAQETFDAFAKFLDAVDIFLSHAPTAVGRVGLARLKFRDALLDRVIPGNVGDQIFEMREGVHGFDGDGLIEGQRVQASHAHEFRHAIYFRGAGTTFSGFAIPADGHIAGLLGLDLVDGVEDHHAFGDGRGVILKSALTFLTAEDAKRGSRHHFIS
jgi:hypothetical protein